jgi:hypothetical protein
MGERRAPSTHVGTALDNPAMASTGALVITSLSAGGFALLGAGLNNWWGVQREKQAFRRESALELADTERMVWGDDWIDLNIQLEKQDTRLLFAGVPNDLVHALHDISEGCWRDLRFNDEMSGGEQPGISADLIEARRLVIRAIGERLTRRTRRPSRDRLRHEAVAAVNKVFKDAEDDPDDPTTEHLRRMKHRLSPG